MPRDRRFSPPSRPKGASAACVRVRRGSARRSAISRASNIAIEFRWAEATIERSSQALPADLVRRKCRRHRRDRHPGASQQQSSDRRQFRSCFTTVADPVGSGFRRRASSGPAATSRAFSISTPRLRQSACEVLRKDDRATLGLARDLMLQCQGATSRIVRAAQAAALTTRTSDAVDSARATTRCSPSLPSQVSLAERAHCRSNTCLTATAR